MLEEMVTWPKAKEEGMPAFLHKMTYPHKQIHEANISKAPHYSFLGEEEEQQEEEEEDEEHHLQGLIHSQISSSPNLSFIPPLPPVAAPPPNKVIYSLSSCARISSFGTRSRSRSRSSPISYGTSPSSISTFMSPPAKSSSFNCSDDAHSAHFELPAINFFDYMKTLLSQLAASISAIKIAYTHQQAALNPYNMQKGTGCMSRQEISIGSRDVFVTDKAMLEELEKLSQLHLQLSLLPHMKLQEQCTCSEGGDMQEDVKKEMGDSVMLKRYEGIITRFHDEIRRKDAVTAALKETLAKSMLRGEKLERRVKALEAQIMRAHI